MSTVIIADGKINGRLILKAWESFSGWYWFAVEEVEPSYFFGFVIGTCPEWGYFSEREIMSLAPLTWEIRPRDIRYISKEVRA
jgi:hypothetical protein